MLRIKVGGITAIVLAAALVAGAVNCGSVTAAADASSAVSACVGVSEEKAAAVISGPDCAELTDGSDEQDRWLTIPDSRLVVNPYNSQVSAELTQHDYSDSASVPLNIGYASPYVGFGGRVQLDDLLEIFAAGKGGEMIYEPQTTDWYAADPGSAAVSVVAGGAVRIQNIASPEPSWQRMSSADFAVNVTENTLVTFEMTERNDGWSMKVCDPTSWTDWNFDVEGKGVYTLNLSQLIGRTGEQTLRLDFYAVGSGAYLEIKNVAVLEPALECAEEYSVTHNPAMNTANASYGDGSGIGTEDFFADATSVVRRIAYTDISAGCIIGGRLFGEARLVGGTIVCVYESCAYAIAAQNVTSLTFYKNRGDMLMSKNGYSDPTGCTCFVMRADSGSEATICFSMNTLFAAQPEETAAHARQLLGGDTDVLLAARIAAWDAILAKVPQPGSFELTVPGVEGLTGAELDAAYYNAWALIAASVLPASPELDYPYRTLANGKPSLWSCGAENSRYAAMWDSPFGMRLLAYIDPDAAWDCLFGLLAEIGADGSIGGEGLPTQKAHTLWHIYRLSPDREKLAQFIAELDRHTLYCMEHPYWIYPGVYMHPDTKDALYTVPLSHEMEYLSLIYDELGNTERAEYWRNERSDYQFKLLYYHFADGKSYIGCRTDGNEYHRYNYDGSGILSSQELIYVTGLRGYYVNLLKAEFEAQFDPEQVAGGLEVCVRAQEPLYCIYGWAAAGKSDISKQLCEIVIRDILKTPMFSEHYRSDDGTTVLAGGVRPSFFTAALFIEAVTFRNNIRIDDGLPYVVDQFGEGAVSNIHIGGKTVSIRVSAGNAQVTGDLSLTAATKDGAAVSPFGGYGFGLTLAGDIDEDGRVTVSDALGALRSAVGLSAQPAGLRLYTADADGDGVVTVSDALLILRAVSDL